MVARRKPRPTPEISILDAAERIIDSCTALIQARPAKKSQQRSNAFALTLAGSIGAMVPDALAIIAGINALKVECPLFSPDEAEGAASAA